MPAASRPYDDELAVLATMHAKERVIAPLLERALGLRVKVSNGIDTDREIAAVLNRRLKAKDQSFTYALLRGVHFQYTSHYPAGLLPAGSSRRQQYAAALAYSKHRFFDILLDGVDRESVAIVYSSDHGQNLANRLLPHCGRAPDDVEFHIPLLAFLPRGLASRYAGSPGTGHTASQIFPATLIWMGYDPKAVQQAYDNDLTQASARRVWFGRRIVPLNPGDTVEVHATPRLEPQ